MIDLKPISLAVLLVACGGQPEVETITPKKELKATQKVAVSLDLDSWERSMKEKQGLVLDVRTPEETAEGIIPGAVLMDYNGPRFEEQLQSLDRYTPVHVYCASGGRSKKSMSIMKELGFQEIYDLNGGYGAWKGSGREIALP